MNGDVTKIIGVTVGTTTDPRKFVETDPTVPEWAKAENPPPTTIRVFEEKPISGETEGAHNELVLVKNYNDTGKPMLMRCLCAAGEECIWFSIDSQLPVASLNDIDETTVGEYGQFGIRSIHDPESQTGGSLGFELLYCAAKVGETRYWSNFAYITKDKITKSLDENSTDAQIPSAKAVYDLFNSIVNGNEVSY